MSVTKLWRLWTLGLTVVVLAWLLLQDSLPSGEQAHASVRQSARLPTIAPPPRLLDPAPELQSLSKSTLWGPIPQRAAAGASDANSAEAAAPKWTLTGYYDASGKRYVVVSFEQQVRPSIQLRLHDKLPDGSRIEAIEPDRVRVRASRASPQEGAPADENVSPVSTWLSITPGLPLPTSRKRN